MAIAKINFKVIHQNIQDLGTPDDQMQSRIFFDLEINEQNYSDLYVDVKQPAGADFSTTPLEVGPPIGYKGPFNHEAFRKEVERAYRDSFGPTGAAIHTSGAGSFYMKNNRAGLDKQVKFDVDVKGEPSGW